MCFEHPAACTRRRAPCRSGGRTGNLFIADTINNVIRKVDTSAITTTFASDPNFSFLSHWLLLGGRRSVSYSKIRKITSAGVISVVAGVEFNCGVNGDRILAITALLNPPHGIAAHTKRNLSIAT